MESFLPDDIMVRGANGEMYSDVWGLTCAQLGDTLVKLLEVRPNAHLTAEDIAGYHFIQYGMDPEVTIETVHGLATGMWSDWDRADNLRANLPLVLANETENVLAARIRLGRLVHSDRLKIQGDFSDYFDNVVELDHHRADNQSLYPKEGVTMDYRGRSSLSIGSAIMGGVLEELEVYTDVLELTMDDGSYPRLVTAQSSNRGTPEIQAIRLM